MSIVRADRNTPGFMRAPPEVPYMFALESAMDELAVQLNMDPIELRRVNDTTKEPIKGNPYTSRSLMACYRRRRQGLWMGPAQCAAEIDVGRRLADRLWLRHHLLSDADGARLRRASACNATAEPGSRSPAMRLATAPTP